jgi:hypothetical protein
MFCRFLGKLACGGPTTGSRCAHRVALLNNRSPIDTRVSRGYVKNDLGEVNCDCTPAPWMCIAATFFSVLRHSTVAKIR